MPARGQGFAAAGGFSYNEMIAYLLLTNISRMFSSMPGLAGGIAREIREGTMKRYLAPADRYDRLSDRLSDRAQGHLYHHVVHPVLRCSFSCAAIFSTDFPTPRPWGPLPFRLSCRSWSASFSRRASAWSGFWFLEVTSLLYIVMTLNFFISGHMLPLDLLPQPWAGHPQVAAVSVHGVFSGRRVSGQGEGNGRWSTTCSASWSGPSSSWCCARFFTGWDCGATALSEVRPWPSGNPSADTFGLLGSLARYTLYRELAFRGNFLVKVSVEVLWLAILVAFYRTVFARTNTIAGWNEPQYFFFVGCFFAMNGLIEMLFLDNCNEFAELVRTGDLDGLLLKPIDEQFLITCRRIDWGTAPEYSDGQHFHGDRACARWTGISSSLRDRYVSDLRWSVEPRLPTVSCCS